MANHGDYVVFLFTSPLNRSFSFRTYNDEFGQVVGFINGYDKDQRPIYHRWKFESDTRKISVHKNKTDKNGTNAVEFLRNSPNCKGSQYGSYTHSGDQIDIYFEEVNDAKTAGLALDLEQLRLDAQNTAFKVKGQDFIDLCALIGVFNKEETVMRFSLVDYAKNKPESFLELYKDPIRQLKSLIRRAVASNVFTKEARMITWENQLIGVDEEDAVNKLKHDENLLKAIKAQLDKIK
jgi:hypothetical protein